MKVKNLLLPLLAIAAGLFVGCQEEKDANLGAPNAIFSDTELNFDQAGGKHNLTMYSSRDWKATSSAEWIGIGRTSGTATSRANEIVITVDPNEGYDRSGQVDFILGKNLMTRSVKVFQKGTGPAPVEGVIVSYNLLTGQGDWTIEDKSKDPALSAVWTYGGTSQGMKATSYANSTNYNAESWLISPEIDLTNAPSALLSIEHAGRYAGTMSKEWLIYVRPVGGEWKQFTIPTYPSGSDWTFVSSGTMDIKEFIGKKIQVGLCYKGSTTKAGTWEVRLVKIETGEGGGTTPDVPTPTPGGVVYTNNFDKTAATQDGTAWPAIGSSDVYKNQSGSGATTVTYSGGAKITVRSNTPSKDYTGASGTNNIFFGETGNFVIEKITLAASRNYTLTFGGYHSLYGASGDANNFDYSKFIVSLSCDGSTWADLTYAFDGGVKAATWALATSTFTLPEGVNSLYIRFATKEASSYRLDDVTLAESATAGTVINITPGGGGTTPTPGGVVYTNNFDKTAATQDGTAWPAIGSSDVYKNQSGSGATTVTYSGGAKITVRSNTPSKDYTGASGTNNIFFGETGNFVIEKITLAASRNYTLTFGGYHSLYGASGDANNFDYSKFIVSLSGDGSTWADLTYAFDGGVKAATWALATSTFTLPEGVNSLYIRFATKEASSYRLDDVTLAESATAGTVINITPGGDTPGGDTPGGDTPSGNVYEKTTSVVAGTGYILESQGKKFQALAADKTYGYLPVADATIDASGLLTGEATDEFVFETATGGFYIKDSQGRYLLMTGTFNSFNLATEAPAEGGVWTVEPQNDGTVKITNVAMNKFIQYDSQYSSVGCYDAATATRFMPTLYVKSSQTPTPSQPVTATVTFAQPSLSMTVGESVTNKATTNSSAAVTYGSSNPRIASVIDGVITAVAAGTATITASVPAVEGRFTAASASCTVTVTAGSGGTVIGDVTFFEETFETGQGEFTIDDKQLAEGLTYVWKHDADHKYMKGSAYAGSNKEAESWLISPEIDLAGATEATLTFLQCINKFFGTVANEAKLYIIGPDGNPVQQTITFPEITSGNWSSSQGDLQTVDLSAFLGKKIKVAFAYSSTTAAAGTWEIWNVKVAGKGPSSGGNTPGGDTPGGDTPGGDTPGGDTPGGGTPAGGGTVLWAETWTGGTGDMAVSSYGFSGTTVYGNGQVSYAVSASNTVIKVDNQMDDGENQPNLIFRGKADANADASTWTITGIPAGGARSAKLTFAVNNKTSNSKYVVTSTTSGVTVGAIAVGSEAAKPFTVTYPITIAAGVASFELVFSNTTIQNVRIDNIQLVTD